MILHVGIAFRVGSSFKVCLNHLWNISEWICTHVLHLGLGLHSITPKLHIGYFETTIHVGIAFKVGFSFKVYLNHLWVILEQIWIWLLHLRLGIHIILQYMHIEKEELCLFFLFSFVIASNPTHINKTQQHFMFVLYIYVLYCVLFLFLVM